MVRRYRFLKTYIKISNSILIEYEPEFIPKIEG